MFTTVTGAPPAGVRPVMTFTEDEGLTLILGQDEADAAGLAYDLVHRVDHPDRAQRP